MPKAAFRLTGEKAAARKLRAIARKYPAKIGAALFLEGNLIMTESKQRFVPVDDGPLRASGKVLPPEGIGVKTEVVMTFGDAASAYALAVHEHPSTHSPPSWKGKKINWTQTGTGPKYLEKPMNDAVKGMPQRLARQLDVDKVV